MAEGFRMTGVETRAKFGPTRLVRSTGTLATSTPYFPAISFSLPLPPSISRSIVSFSLSVVSFSLSLPLSHSVIV